MSSEPFLWGVATAAYQIEGAAAEDGRGPSIWDTFSHAPDKTERGDTGDVACDHYHRVDEDVDLMSALGVNAYRFSISWSRVIPHGTGEVNPKGLRFYSDLVDRLLDAGITPVPTLYHWDLPQALEDRGGWRNRMTARAFAEYARTCVAALGDRVHQWATLNEPWCSSFVGHWHGRHAPGGHDIDDAFTAAHNLLLAHGRAVDAMRAQRPEGSYGIVLNSLPYRAAPGVEPDAIADQLEMLDAVGTGLFYGGVLEGSYPPTLFEANRAFAAAVRPGDMETVGGPIDWLGVNYYSDTLLVSSNEVGCVYPFIRGVSVSPPEQPTDMGWPVTPDGLTQFLLRISDEFPVVPLYLTENGAAYDDPIGPDGTIADEERIRYLAAHIAALRAAASAGADVRGYFVWSLLDNFEWSYGYRMRFGLVHVDFDTLARTPRDSFWWYRRHIAAAGRTKGQG